MKRNWRDYLYILTIVFFVLGLFNILFAWLGFACLLLPFILLAKDKKKTWCRSYCPRVSFFTFLFNKRSLTGKAGPDWLTKGVGKRIVLYYFFLNLFVLTMSTTMVLLDRMEPMEKVRFLIAFVMPWNMPNLLNFGAFPDWTVHLSFRIYSMMFTTTVIGMLLAWVYKPRTWCTVCPIGTISDYALKRAKDQ